MAGTNFAPVTIGKRAGKPRCFVVMGFGKKTDFATGRKLDLDKSYRLLIKPAVEDAGLECVRADEIRHSGVIDVPMYHELLASDFVVADLSTSNANALYELGIRHALRPRTTVVICENRLPYPFDLNHISITSYAHLGDAIDYDEVMRFRKVLADTLRGMKDSQQADSPVYTYIKNLVPPSENEMALDEPEQSGKARQKTAAIAKPAAEGPSLSLLIQEGEKAIEKGEKAIQKGDAFQEGEKAIAIGQFAAAKTFFATALQSASSHGDKEGTIAHDPYLIQRLVLATYMAKQPSHVEALNEAKKLLEVLNPYDSNDPETVGLAGAIEKRLFAEGQGLEHLTAAIWCYTRGYYLRNDWYSAINFAYLLNVRANSELDKTNSERVADLVWANRIRREAIEFCKRDLAEIAKREARASDGGERLQSELEARDHEQKFWCLAASAEASFGLGDFTNYTQTRADAVAASQAEWMVQAMDGQIDKLKTLLTPYGHLLEPPWQPPA